MARLIERPEKKRSTGAHKNRETTVSVFLYGLVRHVMKSKMITTQGDFMYIDDGVHWLKARKDVLNFQFDGEIVYGDSSQEIVVLDEVFGSNKLFRVIELFIFDDISKISTDKDHNEFAIGVLDSGGLLVGFQADIVRALASALNVKFYAVKIGSLVHICTEFNLNGEDIRIVTKGIDTALLKLRFKKLFGGKEFL